MGKQASHGFVYRVRYYLVALDSPPPSFKGAHLSADEAREFANTSGPVLLLTGLPHIHCVFTCACA